MHATTNTTPPSAGFSPAPVSSRVFVRCYRHYDDAKRAFDTLRVDGRIPDTRMSVVARGLEWQEDLPTGSLYKVACSLAAAVGAVVGVILWALGLTDNATDWLTQAVLAGLAGTAIGFVIATIVAWLRGSGRGVGETGHVEPSQYDILVEEDLAATARALLETH